MHLYIAILNFHLTLKEIIINFYLHPSAKFTNILIMQNRILIKCIDTQKLNAFLYFFVYFTHTFISLNTFKLRAERLPQL